MNDKNIDAVAVSAIGVLREAAQAMIDAIHSDSGCIRGHHIAALKNAIAATDRAATVAKDGGEVWEAYARKSGLLDEDGKATDPEKAQTAYFAYMAALSTIKPEASAATQQAGDVRGPLTDAQRDHVRNLYRTLHHLGPGAMEDVVRHASVNGYVNGRLDFGITEAQRAAVGEILGMVANDHMATADIRRIYAKSWECAWSVVAPQYVAAPISEDTAGGNVMGDNWHSLTCDGTCSPPCKNAPLPALPEAIEVGGEGWDWDDFQREKTFSGDHMEEYARACIAADRAARTQASAPWTDADSTTGDWIYWGEVGHEIFGTKDAGGRTKIGCALSEQDALAIVRAHNARASQMEAAPRNAGDTPTVGAVAWAAMAPTGFIRYWSYERKQVEEFASVHRLNVSPIIGVPKSAAPDTRDALTDEKGGDA